MPMLYKKTHWSKTTVCHQTNKQKPCLLELNNVGRLIHESFLATVTVETLKNYRYISEKKNPYKTEKKINANWCWKCYGLGLLRSIRDKALAVINLTMNSATY